VPYPEPPILRVKKAAARDPEFHYDRDRREALKRPRRAIRPGLFARLFGGGGRRTGRRRRFRGVLPALLGVLALVVAIRLLPREPATAHLAGYDLVLRAWAWEDGALASVSATWKPGRRDPSGEAVDVTVRFTAPGTEALAVVTEPFAEGTATVRGRLAAVGKARRVSAEVTIGEARARLAVNAGQP
jgi:hypothetical protein